MMAAEIAIQVNDLGKCYKIYERPQDRLKHLLFNRICGWNYGRDFWALQEVSFQVSRGSTVGIIGRNGAGKSTLLQVITGVLSATKGTCAINGQVSGLLELGSGFSPEYTGRENLYLNGAVHGFDRAAIQQRMPAILEFAGIGEFIDQPVKRYSSGMVVRLAFALISHLEPDVMIIDEALSVGDARFQQRCMRWIRDMKKRATFLFVSHDLSAVRSFCDRALWLDGGRIRMEGDPDLVCRAYIEDSFSVQQSSEPAVAKLSESVACDLPPIQENCQRSGSGAVRIRAAGFINENGRYQAEPQLGGKARFGFRLSVRQQLSSPLIIGLTLKNRLGEPIFSLNSLSDPSADICLTNGSDAVLILAFDFPNLNHGDYAISPAVAIGTQAAHEILDWIHDAVVFQVPNRTQPPLPGVIHIPMVKVETWPNP